MMIKGMCKGEKVDFTARAAPARKGTNDVGERGGKTGGEVKSDENISAEKINRNWARRARKKRVPTGRFRMRADAVLE